MLVTVGAIFPIRPRYSISLPGSNRETVIVPSDTPMDGLTWTSNTVPIPMASVDERTSKTSVCHDGSFRTSATWLKTSADGRAIEIVRSTFIRPPREFANPDAGFVASPVCASSHG
jgi:hypothetical protein